MRRLFYILPLFILVSISAYGQRVYTLSIYAEAEDDNFQKITAAKMGSTVNLAVTLTNFTDDSLPSSTVSLMRSVGQNLDFNTKTSGKLEKQNWAFTSMAGFGYSSTSIKRLKITPDSFVVGNNIVIIWPTDGLAFNNTNAMDTSKFYPVTLKVDTTKSGLNEIATGGISMNIYPNPANSSATINVSGVHNGTLTITDISGKTLIQQAVRGDGSSMKIALPLNINGNALAEGLYFVNLSTENAHCIQKLLISK